MSAESHDTEVQQKKRFPVGPIAVLAVICLASGLALSFMHSKLKDEIKEKKQEAFNAGLAVVLGEAESYPVVNPDATESERVFVAENDMVRQRSVTLGEARDDLIQIMSGLSKTDRVILPGKNGPVDGQRLQ